MTATMRVASGTGLRSVRRTGGNDPKQNVANGPRSGSENATIEDGRAMTGSVAAVVTGKSMLMRDTARVTGIVGERMNENQNVSVGILTSVSR